jgi:hypothetical protein
MSASASQGIVGSFGGSVRFGLRRRRFAERHESCS